MHFLDIHRKIDCTHDPVAKLFVDQFLDRLTVHQVDLMESVNQRIFRNIEGISFIFSLDQPMRSRLPNREDGCDQRKMVKLNLRDSEQRAVSDSETIYFV